jgi:hypothetical protein
VSLQTDGEFVNLVEDRGKVNFKCKLNTQDVLEAVILISYNLFLLVTRDFQCRGVTNSCEVKASGTHFLKYSLGSYNVLKTF